MDSSFSLKNHGVLMLLVNRPCPLGTTPIQCGERFFRFFPYRMIVGYWLFRNALSFPTDEACCPPLSLLAQFPESPQRSFFSPKPRSGERILPPQAFKAPLLYSPVGTGQLIPSVLICQGPLPPFPPPKTTSCQYSFFLVFASDADVFSSLTIPL